MSSTCEVSVWGTLVKELRHEQKMSQYDLSKLSGVSRGSICRIETGVITRIDIKVMETLLETLGYELEAVLIGTPKK